MHQFKINYLVQNKTLITCKYRKMKKKQLNETFQGARLRRQAWLVPLQALYRKQVRFPLEEIYYLIF